MRSQKLRSNKGQVTEILSLELCSSVLEPKLNQLGVPQKIKHGVAIWHSSSTLREMTMYVHTKLIHEKVHVCMNLAWMFIIPLFITAERRVYILIWGWMDKMWESHTIVIWQWKGNEMLIHVSMWVRPENPVSHKDHTLYDCISMKCLQQADSQKQIIAFFATDWSLGNGQ
jgi:hypothetical protein